jgi:hypothetical protein
VGSEGSVAAFSIGTPKHRVGGYIRFRRTLNKRITSLFLWTWANTDFLTKWIQVVALTVAAYWTYTRFLVGEKPSLETRVDITSNLKWENRGPKSGTCYVFFDVQLKNIGISSFAVRGARIRAWRSELPILGNGLAQFLDVDELEHGQNVIDRSNLRLLDMDFAPGERAGRTFSLIFREQPPAIYLFRIDMDAERNGSLTHISTRTWSQNICIAKQSRSLVTRKLATKPRNN